MKNRSQGQNVTTKEDGRDKGISNIVIAVIGALASIAGALITARASFKTQLQEPETRALLNPIDIQAGHALAGTAETKECKLDTPPPKGTSQPVLARVCPVHISFGREFSNVPRVVVGLSYLDLNNDSNTRISVYSSDETTKGFTLNFQTWSYTKVYEVQANWIAFQQR